MTTLKQSANFILKKLFEVKKKEKVLIVTDKIKQNIGKIFYNSAKNISQARIIKIPVARIHGQEPPTFAAKQMKKADVILIITEKSIPVTFLASFITSRTEKPIRTHSYTHNFYHLKGDNRGSSVDENCAVQPGCIELLEGQIFFSIN